MVRGRRRIIEDDAVSQASSIQKKFTKKKQSDTASQRSNSSNRSEYEADFYNEKEDEDGKENYQDNNNENTSRTPRSRSVSSFRSSDNENYIDSEEQEKQFPNIIKRYNIKDPNQQNNIELTEIKVAREIPLNPIAAKKIGKFKKNVTADYPSGRRETTAFKLDNDMFNDKSGLAAAAKSKTSFENFKNKKVKVDNTSATGSIISANKIKGVTPKKKIRPSDNVNVGDAESRISSSKFTMDVTMTIDEDEKIKKEKDSLFAQSVPQPYMTFLPPPRDGLLSTYFDIENRIIESLDITYQNYIHDFDMFGFYPTPTFGGVKGVRSIFGMVVSSFSVAMIFFWLIIYSISFSQRSDPIFVVNKYPTSANDTLSVNVAVALSVNGLPYWDERYINLKAYYVTKSNGDVTQSELTLNTCNYTDITPLFTVMYCLNTSTITLIGVTDVSQDLSYISIEARAGSYCLNSTSLYNSSSQCLQDPTFSSIWQNCNLNLLIPSRIFLATPKYINAFFAYVGSQFWTQIDLYLSKTTLTDYKNVHTFFDDARVGSYTDIDYINEYYYVNNTNTDLVWRAHIRNSQYFNDHKRLYRNIFDLFGHLGGMAFILSCFFGGIVLCYNSQLFYQFYSWDLEPVNLNIERVHQVIETKAFPVDYGGVPISNQYIKYDPPTKMQPIY